MFTWLCVFTTTVVVPMRIPFLALDPAFLGCSGWNPRNGCKWVMKQQPYPGQCEDRARCHHCFGHEMEYEEDGRQDWHLVQDIPSASSNLALRIGVGGGGGETCTAAFKSSDSGGPDERAFSTSKH